MGVQAQVTMPLPVASSFALMADLGHWLPQVDESVLSVTRVSDFALIAHSDGDRPSGALCGREGR